MRVQIKPLHPLEFFEAIPCLSTITSIACMALKCSINVKSKTSLGLYLNSLSFGYLALTLIPIVNVIAFIFKSRLCANSAQFAKTNHVTLANKVASSAKPPQVGSASVKNKTSDIYTSLYAAQAALSSRPRAAGATSGDVFTEDDILRKYEFTEAVNPYEAFDPRITFMKCDDVHVGLQESPEGCSAGVAAMLALDHGKVVNYHEFKSRKAACYARITQDLEGAGLTVKSTPLENLEDPASKELVIDRLKASIQENGPTCVRIQPVGSTMAHWVIVDDVSLEQHMVTLRDPWHGYMIGVTLDAFSVQWKNAWTQAKAAHLTCRLVQIQS
jgi:Papain-like cysteine protease AvrRpt2